MVRLCPAASSPGKSCLLLSHGEHLLVVVFNICCNKSLNYCVLATKNGAGCSQNCVPSHLCVPHFQVFTVRSSTSWLLSRIPLNTKCRHRLTVLFTVFDSSFSTVLQMLDPKSSPSRSCLFVCLFCFGFVSFLFCDIFRVVVSGRL